MKRVWPGFRKSNYKDENKIRVRKEQREKLKQLISVGGHEAESQYVELLKQWIPDIGPEELREKIRQYHDAVSDRQARDRESR